MIKKIITILILIPLSFLFFSFPSSAYVCLYEDYFGDFEVIEKEYNERYKTFTKDVTSTEWYDNYVLYEKLTIREDVVIGRNAELHLKRGAILIIKGGASLTVYGELIMERGSKLYVTDGSFTTIGRYENHGRIIVRETGELNIIGMYKSGVASSIRLDGKGSVGKKSLNELIAEINEYDENFNLNSYFMNYTGVGGKITFKYHIGDVATNYYYSYLKGEHKRKWYPLEKVYDKELEEKLLLASEEYYEKNKVKEKFNNEKYSKYLRCVNYGFEYNYSTKRFRYGDMYFMTTDDVVMDKLYEDTIKL
ncbi:MAG: hypothetical protein IJX15_04430 [Ruminiclostridium sp.]|nr:hypothetical protein [Ruminiclostridium sp.]